MDARKATRGIAILAVAVAPAWAQVPHPISTSASMSVDRWQREDPVTFLGLGGPADCIAYDPLRERIVTYGTDYDHPQVWERDNGTWIGRGNTGVSPWWNVFAWDPVRRQVIAFGGMTPILGGKDDMSAWDGRGWHLLFPDVKPSARAFHAMATDTARNRVVLFGGDAPLIAGPLLRPPPEPYFDDTWEWNGTGWIERQPAHSPAARSDHVMAYDSARDRTVLFGGRSTNPDGRGFRTFTDTWEWDGDDWTERIVPVTPSLEVGFGLQMVYDTARERIVLVGANEEKVETWEWDGSTWELVNITSDLIPGAGWAMVYDEARRETVLLTFSSAFSYWYTWIYSPRVSSQIEGRDGVSFEGAARRGPAPGDSVAAYGAGVAGSGGIVPRLGVGGGPPYLGNDDFRLELTQALGGTSAYILGAPSPDNLMIGGLTYYLDPRTAARWLVLTSGTPGASGVGTATLRMPIPGDPSLLGFESYWQGFVWDSGSLHNGISYTHGLRVTVIR